MNEISVTSPGLYIVSLLGRSGTNSNATITFAVNITDKCAPNAISKGSIQNQSVKVGTTFQYIFQSWNVSIPWCGALIYSLKTSDPNFTVPNFISLQ